MIYYHTPYLYHFFPDVFRLKLLKTVSAGWELSSNIIHSLYPGIEPLLPGRDTCSILGRRFFSPVSRSRRACVWKTFI